MTIPQEVDAAGRGVVDSRILLGDISAGFTRTGNGSAVVFVHGLAEDRHSCIQPPAKGKGHLTVRSRG